MAQSMKTGSARERLEHSLQKIGDPSGEGKRAFLTLYPDSAYEAADAADRRALEGRPIGALDGAIVSIKDLFDVAGEPTRAGSTILADAPPARRDSLVVERLRQAGAVIVGKTNMSEFAFTGIGANPHYGTPGNPFDRGRVPGGSSSGAAVAVADKMCEISIGTDTGGSTRIPAALCGLVGYKPTKVRIPTSGAFPLSPTLDSIGPLARSVEDCAKADSILANEQPFDLKPVPLERLRIGIAHGLPLEDLDFRVAERFDAALKSLGAAGARLLDMKFPIFDDMAQVQSPATIATVEAYQIHHDRIAANGAAFDPVVRFRIETGGAVSTSDYKRMLEDRSRLVSLMDLSLGEVDALILPTTPIVAPRIAEISNSRDFNRANRLLLRNTAIANFFDLCAISLPMPAEGSLPSGLMIFARGGHDRELFRLAASIEKIL